MAWFWLIVLNLAAAYVMAGYPLLLNWLAKHHGRPFRKGLEHQPEVSVLIAVHNGGKCLRRKLDSLLASDYPRELLEIIVISDGSSDETEEIAASYAGQGVILLRQPKLGKPSAINAGVERASHEILIFTDVRQTFERWSISKLIACFADPEVGVVSGYLEIRRGSQEENNVGAYWKYERWIRRNLSALDSVLGATGAFYGMRRELFRPMPVDLLLDDMYVPLQAFFRGFRLVLEPEAVIYDVPTDVSSEFRRKVRTLAGNYQLIRYMPELLSPRNRMLGHFVSYKMGRLLLPWLFAGVLISSFFLPDPWRWTFVVPQFSAYGLAWLDAYLKEGSVMKKISSPARTVVSLLAASALAVMIFFVPAERLWTPTRVSAKNE